MWLPQGVFAYLYLCICVCICETVALWSACLRHLQPDAASRCQQVSDMREQLFGEETAGLLFASFHPQSISKFQIAMLGLKIFLCWAIFVQIPVWRFKGWLCTATDLVVDLTIKLLHLAIFDLKYCTQFCEISLRIVNSPALPSSVGLSWHSGIPSTAQVAPASTQCREVRQSATRLDSPACSLHIMHVRMGYT